MEAFHVFCQDARKQLLADGRFTARLFTVVEANGTQFCIYGGQETSAVVSGGVRDRRTLERERVHVYAYRAESLVLLFPPVCLLYVADLESAHGAEWLAAGRAGTVRQCLHYGREHKAMGAKNVPPKSTEVDDEQILLGA